ncbi:ABC transporter ATP-binding protein [Micromonospora parathelypteridis]|uniref:ABC-2 type transport system ATP-binding protein n=1 Tax=Micromonospora parathelypteridis TaxID=1839617 RepID=A0A840VW26_9ACTN|nr:ABC transporter ATP-binding protein [Micromonospora parathelypteridis]MBB5480935.1 ABC-2 type transport system ATP-binding protein [Micromonospora parathelypteridis]GGO20885.1 ABC transporter ATP-binding protein [Micromonospora parathelypteridis]
MTVVQATGLALRYGRTTALGDVSFTLRTGVTGLLGPNGAGKTTLLRIVATALPADGGTLRVFGHDPSTPPGRLAVRRRLGYLPQDPGFHPSFTAFEFVDYVAILKELTHRSARHAEVARVLSAVGLDDRRRSRIRTLSGGMKQRLALAAALVGDPDLVILDEPTVGLDPEQRLRFRELIADLGERKTVLLSTHQTEDVMSLCQEVIVLDRGRVRFEGTPAKLAGLAAGRVWTSAERQAGALASWRTGTGLHRHVGDPPPGATLVEPSIEDGYLTLVDAGAEASASAGGAR